MSETEKADIVERLRADVFYGDERLARLRDHNPLHLEAAAEIERLRALTSRAEVLEEAATKNDAMAKRLRLLARDLADYAKAHAEGGYEYLEQTAAAIRALKSKDQNNG